MLVNAQMRRPQPLGLQVDAIPDRPEFPLKSVVERSDFTVPGKFRQIGVKYSVEPGVGFDITGALHFHQTTMNYRNLRQIFIRFLTGCLFCD